MRNANVAPVDRTDRRRYPRSQVNRPARIRVANGNPSPVQLMDISPRGASLYYSAPLPAGTPVRLKFYLHTDTETVLLRLTGEVQQSHLRGESHFIRITFTNPPMQAVKLIHDFARQRQRSGE